MVVLVVVVVVVNGGGASGGVVTGVMTQWLYLKMAVMAKVKAATTATNLAWVTDPFMPSQIAEKASNTKAPQFHP